MVRGTARFLGWGTWARPAPAPTPPPAPRGGAATPTMGGQGGLVGVGRRADIHKALKEPATGLREGRRGGYVTMGKAFRHATTLGVALGRGGGGAPQPVLNP